MIYSKKFPGKELKNELKKGYNISRISSWAEMCHHEISNNSELKDVLYDIMMMDAGPEFEYSKEELHLLAELLVNAFKDPINKINDLKNKELYLIKLHNLIAEISENLPLESQERIYKYFKKNEVEISFIRLCNNILKHEIYITLDYYDRISLIGNSMELDPSVWLPLKNLII